MNGAGAGNRRAFIRLQDFIMEKTAANLTL